MINQLPIKELHYNNLIKPLLKFPPTEDNLLYFYEQAWRFWTLWLWKVDMKEILIIEDICTKLLAEDKELTIDIFTEIYEKLHDFRTNLERVRDIYYKNKDTDIDNDHKFQQWFEYYKSFFENEFNLWSSPIVTYLLNYTILPKKIRDNYKRVSNFVNLWSWSKYSIISSANILKSVDNIDTLIRNAWAWHDSRDLQDNWKCKLKNIKPTTWEVLSEVIISLDDLDEKIKLMEKVCFIFDLWTQIFLHNTNLDSSIVIKSWAEVKVKEIERVVSMLAKTYHLKLNKLTFLQSREDCELEIEKIYKMPSAWIWSVYTDRSREDVVEIKKEVKYIDQSFWLVNQILHLNKNNSFNLSLKIIDNYGNVIFSWNFEKNEIAKILLWDKSNYPIPKSGTLPDATYILISEMLVPYGAWAEIQNVLNNPLFTKEYRDVVLSSF